MKNEKRKINNKGMTLFIAVVVMGILLFISFAVVNITLKSTLFASSGRDSQFAFYAADAGLECALYWDSKFVVGQTEDPVFPIYGSAFDPSASERTIDCGGTTGISDGDPISGTSVLTQIGDGEVSTFGFVMNTGSNSVLHCAIVTVTKNVDGSTHIKSRGYNTCDSNLRRVERGIEVDY